MLVDLWLRSYDVTAFYTGHGIMPMTIYTYQKAYVKTGPVILSRVRSMLNFAHLSWASLYNSKSAHKLKSFSFSLGLSICRPYYWSVYFLSEGRAFVVLLMWIHAIFAAMLLVGYQSRVASVGSWVLLLSIQNRNSTILDGGDFLLMNLLFWGTFFLPWRYMVTHIRHQWCFYSLCSIAWQGPECLVAMQPKMVS